MKNKIRVQQFIHTFKIWGFGGSSITYKYIGPEPKDTGANPKADAKNYKGNRIYAGKEWSVELQCINGNPLSEGTSYGDFKDAHEMLGDDIFKSLLQDLLYKDKFKALGENIRYLIAFCAANKWWDDSGRLLNLIKNLEQIKSAGDIPLETFEKMLKEAPETVQPQLKKSFNIIECAKDAVGRDTFKLIKNSNIDSDNYSKALDDLRFFKNNNIDISKYDFKNSLLSKLVNIKPVTQEILDIIAAVIDAGAKVTLPENAKLGPLKKHPIIASCSNSNLAIFDLLLDKLPLDTNKAGENIFNVFYYAVMCHSLEAIESLVKRGFKPTARPQSNPSYNILCSCFSNTSKLNLGNGDSNYLPLNNDEVRREIDIFCAIVSSVLKDGHEPKLSLTPDKLTMNHVMLFRAGVITINDFVDKTVDEAISLLKITENDSYQQIELEVLKEHEWKFDTLRSLIGFKWLFCINDTDNLNAFIAALKKVFNELCREDPQKVQKAQEMLETWLGIFATVTYTRFGEKRNAIIHYTLTNPAMLDILYQNGVRVKSLRMFEVSCEASCDIPFELKINKLKGIYKEENIKALLAFAARSGKTEEELKGMRHEILDDCIKINDLKALKLNSIGFDFKSQAGLELIKFVFSTSRTPVIRKKIINFLVDSGVPIIDFSNIFDSENPIQLMCARNGINDIVLKILDDEDRYKGEEYKQVVYCAFHGALNYSNEILIKMMMAGGHSPLLKLERYPNRSILSSTFSDIRYEGEDNLVQGHNNKFFELDRYAFYNLISYVMIDEVSEDNMLAERFLSYRFVKLCKQGIVTIEDFIGKDVAEVGEIIYSMRDDTIIESQNLVRILQNEEPDALSNPENIKDLKNLLGVNDPRTLNAIILGLKTKHKGNPNVQQLVAQELQKLATAEYIRFGKTCNEIIRYTEAGCSDMLDILYENGVRITGDFIGDSKFFESEELWAVQSFLKRDRVKRSESNELIRNDWLYEKYSKPILSQLQTGCDLAKIQQFIKRNTAHLSSMDIAQIMSYIAKANIKNVDIQNNSIKIITMFTLDSQALHYLIKTTITNNNIEGINLLMKADVDFNIKNTKLPNYNVLCNCFKGAYPGIHKEGKISLTPNENYDSEHQVFCALVSSVLNIKPGKIFNPKLTGNHAFLIRGGLISIEDFRDKTCEQAIDLIERSQNDTCMLYIIYDISNSRHSLDDLKKGEVAIKVCSLFFNNPESLNAFIEGLGNYYKNEDPQIEEDELKRLVCGRLTELANWSYIRFGKSCNAFIHYTKSNQYDMLDILYNHGVKIIDIFADYDEEDLKPLIEFAQRDCKDDEEKSAVDKRLRSDSNKASMTKTLKCTIDNSDIEAFKLFLINAELINIRVKDVKDLLCFIIEKYTDYAENLNRDQCLIFLGLVLQSKVADAFKNDAHASYEVLSKLWAGSINITKYHLKALDMLLENGVDPCKRPKNNPDINVFTYLFDAMPIAPGDDLWSNVDCELELEIFCKLILAAANKLYLDSENFNAFIINVKNKLNNCTIKLLTNFVLTIDDFKNKTPEQIIELLELCKHDESATDKLTECLKSNNMPKLRNIAYESDAISNLIAVNRPEVLQAIVNGLKMHYGQREYATPESVKKDVACHLTKLANASYIRLGEPCNAIIHYARIGGFDMLDMLYENGVRIFGVEALYLENDLLHLIEFAQRGYDDSQKSTIELNLYKNHTVLKIKKAIDESNLNEELIAHYDSFISKDEIKDLWEYAIELTNNINDETRLKILNILIKSNAATKAKSDAEFHEHLLYLSIVDRNLEAVNILLENGIDPFKTRKKTPNLEVLTYCFTRFVITINVSVYSKETKIKNVVSCDKELEVFCRLIWSQLRDQNMGNFDTFNKNISNIFTIQNVILINQGIITLGDFKNKSMDEAINIIKSSLVDSVISNKEILKELHEFSATSTKESKKFGTDNPLFLHLDNLLGLNSLKALNALIEDMKEFYGSDPTLTKEEVKTRVIEHLTSLATARITRFGKPSNAMICYAQREHYGIFDKLDKNGVQVHEAKFWYGYQYTEYLDLAMSIVYDESEQKAIKSKYEEYKQKRELFNNVNNVINACPLDDLKANLVSLLHEQDINCLSGNVYYPNEEYNCLYLAFLRRSRSITAGDEKGKQIFSDVIKLLLKHGAQLSIQFELHYEEFGKLFLGHIPLVFDDLDLLKCVLKTRPCFYDSNYIITESLEVDFLLLRAAVKSHNIKLLDSLLSLDWIDIKARTASNPNADILRECFNHISESGVIDRSDFQSQDEWEIFKKLLIKAIKFNVEGVEKSEFFNNWNFSTLTPHHFKLIKEGIVTIEDFYGYSQNLVYENFINSGYDNICEPQILEYLRTKERVCIETHNRGRYSFEMSERALQMPNLVGVNSAKIIKMIIADLEHEFRSEAGITEAEVRAKVAAHLTKLANAKITRFGEPNNAIMRYILNKNQDILEVLHEYGVRAISIPAVKWLNDLKSGWVKNETDAQDLTLLEDKYKASIEFKNELSQLIDALNVEEIRKKLEAKNIREMFDVYQLYFSIDVDHARPHWFLDKILDKKAAALKKSTSKANDEINKCDQIIDLLIEAGAKVGPVNKDEVFDTDSGLIKACNCDAATLGKLLYRLPNLKENDRAVCWLFERAIELENLDIIILLLNKGLDPFKKDPQRMQRGILAESFGSYNLENIKVFSDNKVEILRFLITFAISKGPNRSSNFKYVTSSTEFRKFITRELVQNFSKCIITLEYFRDVKFSALGLNNRLHNISTKQMLSNSTHSDDYLYLINIGQEYSFENAKVIDETFESGRFGSKALENLMFVNEPELLASIIYGYRKYYQQNPGVENENTKQQLIKCITKLLTIGIDDIAKHKRQEINSINDEIKHKVSERITQLSTATYEGIDGMPTNAITHYMSTGRVEMIQMLDRCGVRLNANEIDDKVVKAQFKHLIESVELFNGSSEEKFATKCALYKKLAQNPDYSPDANYLNERIPLMPLSEYMPFYFVITNQMDKYKASCGAILDSSFTAEFSENSFGQPISFEEAIWKLSPKDMEKIGGYSFIDRPFSEFMQNNPSIKEKIDGLFNGADNDEKTLINNELNKYTTYKQVRLYCFKFIVASLSGGNVNPGQIRFDERHIGILLNKVSRDKFYGNCARWSVEDINQYLDGYGVEKEEVKLGGSKSNWHSYEPNNIGANMTSVATRFLGKNERGKVNIKPEVSNVVSNVAITAQDSSNTQIKHSGDTEASVYINSSQEEDINVSTAANSIQSDLNAQLSLLGLEVTSLIFGAITAKYNLQIYPLKTVRLSMLLFSPKGFDLEKYLSKTWILDNKLTGAIQHFGAIIHKAFERRVVVFGAALMAPLIMSYAFKDDKLHLKATSCFYVGVMSFFVMKNIKERAWMNITSCVISIALEAFLSLGLIGYIEPLKAQEIIDDTNHSTTPIKETSENNISDGSTNIREFIRS